MHFLAHGAGVADDAARPVEHAFAFRREALEARAAVDQQHAETVFDLLHPSREGWLGDAAGLGGPPEMLFPRQSEQKFELIDHDVLLVLSVLLRCSLAKMGVEGIT